MKEKELRLALVCYGGVSLAIYEHGICREILNLVRASRAYHARHEISARQAETYTYAAVDGREPGGTEPVYFDLLKQLGGQLDLRVVVDVITGSSAGGVNGVTLARALAHDLSLEPLTQMWLADADIQRLLAREAKADRWSKWYLKPFLTPLFRRLGREGLLPPIADLEARAALSTFIRSRWFHPPLDGEGFSGLLLDGLHAMPQGRSEAGSLLPAGHRLDLIVTVTDYYGSARTIFIHDPPVVREREHRHVLRFSFEQSAGGAAFSDFGPDHIPSLAFAARATASYPGAFPPAQLREIDELLRRRAEGWPARERFVAENFAHYVDAGLAPEDAFLVDGSVLNNKPLSEAIAATRTHSAFREVDRRLVYIDPHPYKETPRAHRLPGFMATLRAALSDLPRSEPIYDELAEIDDYNKQVRQRRAFIEANRDQVVALVRQATEGRLDGPVSVDDVRRWRLNGTQRLAGAGLGHSGWMHLMITEAIKTVARLIAQACDYPAASPRCRWIEDAIEVWARRVGFHAGAYVFAPVGREDELPAFGRFIANFGVSYKKRRIAFVIQAANLLYHQPPEADCHVDPAVLDVLKRRLYRCLDSLRVYDSAAFLSAETARQINDLFGGLPEATSRGALPDQEGFVRDRLERISAVLERVSDECDLVGLNEEVDAIMVSPTAAALGHACQREILTSYVGYLFWDMALLPMTTTGAPALMLPLEEILVDRISPEDAQSLQLGKEGPILRGGTLAGFGGFFSRSTRENDYLWGRLHAVDRLFDLLASTATAEVASGGVDIGAFKKRAFANVLGQEAGRLSQAADLIARLRSALEVQ